MNPLVIGIGNEYRGDDAAGRLVARRLKDMEPADVDVVEASGESAGLMELWSGREKVWLVDAVESRQPPGLIHRLEAHVTELPREFFHCSTHAFSVAEAVELARSLDLLPPEVVVYGIEGQWFEAGQKLTSEVASAIDEVAEQIRNEINEQKG